MSAGTPAVRLRQAAKLLRERATEASHGPWHVEYVGEQGYPQVISNAAAVLVAETFNGPPAQGMNAEWIAMVHPGIAEPLAAWLDLMARIAEFAAERGYRTSTQTDAALAVADVILAGGDHHA